MEESIFYTKNRKKLANRLENGTAAILFAGCAPYKRGDEVYPFSVDRNFYYVTGVEEENCIFLMTKQHDQVQETLYIPRDNGPLAKWVGETISPQEAEKISGMAQISYVDLFRQDLADTILRQGLTKVALDLENRDWQAAPVTGVSFALEVKQQYPAMELVDLYPVFGDLRLIKEDWEIKRLEKAMEITRLGLENLIRHTKPGMKEYEAEAYFDFTLMQHGAREKAFATIVAAGRRGTILHYHKNTETIQAGDLVLVDCGAQYKWYNGDITRTFPANGKFSPRQKQVYDIVLEGQKRVMDAIRPGVPFARLNEILKEYYLEALKELGLAQTMEDVSRYYYHGVSHYLGAETHDIGRYIARDLAEGMVLTVEPGLYIEEWGIGIRTEDDVLVTKDGCRNLTAAMPKTTEEIEALMAEGK